MPSNSNVAQQGDGSSSSATNSTVTEGVTVLGAANTAQKVSATSVPFVIAFFYGFKAIAGAVVTNNAGVVSIGKSAAYQPDTIQPGALDFTIEAPDGETLDLMNIYIIGANVGDGVFWSVLT
jgi:hypothetical protein